MAFAEPSADSASAAAFGARWNLRVSAAVLLGASGLLFQFFGNATHGYIHSSSLFVWLGAQWFDPAADASQGPLVVGIALVLLIWNWCRLAPLSYSEDGDERAFAWIAGALGLHALGYAAQQTRLSVVALLLLLAGVLALAGGQRAIRAARFPLSFTLLAIPVGFLQPWSFSLRLAISESVQGIFRTAGHPILREGTQLFSADGRQAYDVEAACSGVHSLIALGALAILLAYLRVPTWPRKLILVATVAPFAFVGNLLRVLAIVAAGEARGPAAAQRIHSYSGFLVFAVVFALLWATMRGCAGASSRRIRERTTSAFPAEKSASSQQVGFSERVVGVRPHASSDFGPSGEARESANLTVSPRSSRVTSRRRSLSGRHVAMATGLLLAEVALVGFTAHVLDRVPAGAHAGIKLAAGGTDPIALPEFLGTEWVGQHVDVTAVERSILPPDTGYSRKNYVSVADRSGQVFVSVVLSGQDRTSIHRPELCLVGQGWAIEKSEHAEFTVGAPRVADSVSAEAAGTTKIPVTLLHVRREVWDRNGERRTLHSLLAYTFIGENDIEATHAGMLWRNALHRLRYVRGERWAYLIVQTWLKDTGNVTETLGAGQNQRTEKQREKTENHETKEAVSMQQNGTNQARAFDESTARERMQTVLSPVWEDLRS